MNKDQIKGTAKEVAGKVQNKVGQAINSPSQQAKGLAKETEGHVQKSYGDVKESIKDAGKH